jgi:subtilisin family serine protease
MGSNPNCSSFRSFEGFGGRPCTQRSRRGVAQSSGGNAQPPKNATKNTPKNTAQKGPIVVAVADSVPNEIIIEVEGVVTEAQAIALSERHRLTRVESQNFPLIGATMFRWRIPERDRRSVETVARQLMAGGGVKSVQRNHYFKTLQAGTARDDPGQYAIGKLFLTEAHAVTKGEEVRIAVIDSGIDVAHPELAGAIAGTYDALRSTDGPHTHGTGIAGAIAARARLLGSAPAARLLAIRAFGATSSGAESTSFVVLKGLNYAVEQGAQIINMSFAGPKDPLLERGLAAAAKRGIILIAAAGNAGPKSPPLYPAADRNVIAVSATDSADKLFEASNRGNHLALAAPGVDLLLPAPDEKYQVASGTSFAAAYVSGLAALIVERNPGVAPEVVRRILTDTARDLGPQGKDDQFGAGLANALAAVQAARPVTAGAASRAIELPKATR